jgi:hypothetical protein
MSNYNTIIEIKAKQCSKCKLIKVCEDFGKAKNSKSGLKSWCNKCCAELTALNKFKNSEKNILIKKEYNKQYNQNNKTLRKEKEQQKRINDPLRYKKQRLRSRYGISYEEYLILLERNGNCCRICGITNEKYNELYHKDLSIDHCHTSKIIRGILCDNCNTGLGQFKDDIELLDKAKNYLLQYNS